MARSKICLLFQIRNLCKKSAFVNFRTPRTSINSFCRLLQMGVPCNREFNMAAQILVSCRPNLKQTSSKTSNSNKPRFHQCPRCLRCQAHNKCHPVVSLSHSSRIVLGMTKILDFKLLPNTLNSTPPLRIRINKSE